MIEAVENIDGVINVINKAGQYQLLIGTEVGKLYDEFEPLVKGESTADSTESNESSGNIISNIFQQYQQFLHRFYLRWLVLVSCAAY